jgi:hypothetical protein
MMGAVAVLAGRDVKGLVVAMQGTRPQLRELRMDVRKLPRTTVEQVSAQDSIKRVLPTRVYGHARCDPQSAAMSST